MLTYVAVKRIDDMRSSTSIFDIFSLRKKLDLDVIDARLCHKH